MTLKESRRGVCVLMHNWEEYDWSTIIGDTTVSRETEIWQMENIKKIKCVKTSSLNKTEDTVEPRITISGGEIR